jgi:hypothetical protein
MRKQLVVLLLVLVQFLVFGACRKTEQGPILRGTDWEEVRSVPHPSGGTIDFVVVPESKQRDKAYYTQVSAMICGQRTSCMVNFWTDRKHIPESAWMRVEDLAVMTASYERSPSYKEPSLHLACWLYATKAVGEADKCDYEPGARRPPDI